jgi:glycosyltransferase involved in cell wall biosynthesis
MDANYWKNVENFPPLGRKLRILVVLPNEGGCAYYRGRLPFEILVKQYPNVVEVRFEKNPLGLNTDTGKWKDDWDWSDVDWADIVFGNNISNFGGAYTARVCGKAKERGKIFHYDTDDLLTQLYKGHRLEKVYEEGLSDTTKFIYSNSDIVTVTQRKFAERIKPFISNGILGVVKNAIDYDLPAWNADKTPPPRKNLCRFGWAGGIHHEEDVKEFAGIPNMVNQRAGRENVRWDFYGRPPQQQVAQAPNWLKLPNNLKDTEAVKAAVDAVRVEHQGDLAAHKAIAEWEKSYVEWAKELWQQDVWKNYERTLMKGFRGKPNYNIFAALPTHSYGVFYSNMDVAIAPLQMNEFNDSKSEIKVAECGRYSVPLIASNVGCYDEWIVNGETGFLIDHDAPKKVWVQTLTKVARDKKLRERMGANLHFLTEQYFNINNMVHDRLNIYQQFYDWKKDGTETT